MKLDYVEFTHIGARKINQDYFAHCLFEDAACFVIADGLGGHQKGEVVSSAICEAIIEKAPDFYHQQHDNPVLAMEYWLIQSSELMREYILKHEGNIDAHTTLALVWIDTEKMLTAHVGDSRIYRLSPPHGIWRTSDHTYLQQEFDEGKVSESEFLGHPLQNRLIKTVNLSQPPQADIFVHPPLCQGETILLCTDGFWSYLTKKDLETFSQPSGKQAVEHKIAEILKTYPSQADNITVQMVRLI